VARRVHLSFLRFFIISYLQTAIYSASKQHFLMYKPVNKQFKSNLIYWNRYREKNGMLWYSVFLKNAWLRKLERYSVSFQQQHKIVHH